MTPETKQLIDAENARAREKFPGPHDLAALVLALFEEVGELSRAFLEGEPDNFRREAVQVASMAVRILEEGADSRLWAANHWRTGEA